ncbi:hypothetical protein [Methylobacterium brachiatum]|jgi:hypothetical protein|uniref:hypothetical protein n=1 Tax=Methylobacterium brachiatum TaxID=269660 RepID=UPI0024496326|nr:hypothetical protein [Methylobacterium brachiatum]MDH2308390.1 hypothetical protein [Methylobacterium brachiatum]
MILVLRSTHGTTARGVRPPITLEAGNDAGARIIADAARYQTIGSFQALALAVAAAVVTPALLGLAL